MKTNAPLGMLSTLVAALAPNVEAQDDVWVFFKDKPAISQREIAANFSERAVARRQRARVSWDFFDAPVNPAYLETLQATGVAVKYASRWLNAAACSMNENQRRVVENMQFVTGVRPCARMRHARHCTADFAQATLSHPVYGNGFQQVRMLGVDTLHALGYNGKGVVVAVFDDGFLNADLVSAFADMRAEGRLLGVYDFVENDSSVFHVGAHGTAVLSVLAGYLTG
ncbi:MAG: hypothetical protein RMM53_08660 [Bacteroidia bacterium]|nr:hypothetical protein [Bacteroidia bacterium]